MSEMFKCTKNFPIVETKQGKLHGYVFDGVYNFFGVKYAKAERFHMPEEPDSWEGVREALAYGVICPILQSPAPGDEIVVPHRFWPESEHCQNLNIWTTSIDPTAKKPVMVWFHGGGYSSGSAMEHVAYEGDRLAKYDDVVTVCVNHRLNAFGHLDLSAFGEEYKNSVNVGIADLVAALKWIKENIAAFGGDPENVTIFGQSGGGGKVTTLGQTPAADGLFQRAIVMSGVFRFSEGKKVEEADPKAFAIEIMSQLGLKETEVRSLEKVPYKLFIRAVNKAARKFEQAGYAINWAPHKNDWYVGDPLEVGFREHFNTVPTMVGSVLGEFYSEIELDDKENIPVAEREAEVMKRYGEEEGKKVLELFRKAYPGKNELFALDIDTGCRMASADYVREKAKGEAPVFCYMFAPCFDYAGGRAPWHCADIPFFFHNSERIPFTYSIDYRERLEREMVDSFVNFAKNGVPSSDLLPEWKPAEEKDLYTMVYDEKTELKKNYDDELTAYIRSITKPFSFNFVTPDEDEESDRQWLY